METMPITIKENELKQSEYIRMFEDLQVGESFFLVSNTEPIEVKEKLTAKYGDTVSWQVIEHSPMLWKIHVKKMATPIMATGNDAPLPELNDSLLNVMLLQPADKHKVIFQYFDALQPGMSFRILNDHDPKPLYYQLIGERGSIFTWKYIQKGPVWWEVELRKNEGGVTIGQLVTADIRKAEVFKRHGIDFCCGGKKTVKQACEEKNIDIVELEKELATCAERSLGSIPLNFSSWQPDFLSDYIYNQHHKYYYEAAPVIAELCEKVALKHGRDFPKLYEVKKLVDQLQCELKTHFTKEEKVLFPFIKALVKAKGAKDAAELSTIPSLKEPMQMMEADHDAAGEILSLIRQETENFTPPANSCNSWRLFYQKLSDLESDLHQHVHLENNVLFPKVLQMEKEM